jgi:hypothetical protein
MTARGLADSINACITLGVVVDNYVSNEICEANYVRFSLKYSQERYGPLDIGLIESFVERSIWTVLLLVANHLFRVVVLPSVELVHRLQT